MNIESLASGLAFSTFSSRVLYIHGETEEEIDVILDLSSERYDEYGQLVSDFDTVDIKKSTPVEPGGFLLDNVGGNNIVWKIGRRLSDDEIITTYVIDRVEPSDFGFDLELDAVLA